MAIIECRTEIFSFFNWSSKMNDVTIYGNLTRDPEVKVIEAGGRKTSVVNFTVAINRRYTKQNGDKAEDTTFVNCEAWDTGAETIGKYLTKGSPILLKGSIKNETWEKEGQKHSRTKVRVANFTLMPKSSKAEPKAVEPPQETAKVPVDTSTDEGDVPF